ncbi:MAG TPA: hypothetical protein VK636_18325 [Gemmatimonadaceae bacterium]|nr:hypothetical protein [Gemmatimonadaceae bacterium]
MVLLAGLMVARLSRRPQSYFGFAMPATPSRMALPLVGLAITAGWWIRRRAPGSAAGALARVVDGTVVG